MSENKLQESWSPNQKSIFQTFQTLSLALCISRLMIILQESDIHYPKLNWREISVAPDFLKYGWASANSLLVAKANATFSSAFSVLVCSKPKDFCEKERVVFFISYVCMYLFIYPVNSYITYITNTMTYITLHYTSQYLHYLQLYVFCNTITLIKRKLFNWLFLIMILNLGRW